MHAVKLTAHGVRCATLTGRFDLDKSGCIDFSTELPAALTTLRKPPLLATACHMRAHTQVNAWPAGHESRGKARDVVVVVLSYSCHAVLSFLPFV